MSKILLSWSSGKDSAWALRILRAQGREIGALLTTFNSAFDRVAMHAVRRALVVEQAARLGVPLWPVELPWPCSNVHYETCLGEVVQRAVSEGFTQCAFGDLFLQDIREYRERQLHDTGLEPVFPLWNLPTAGLAREMIAGGLQASITCVDPKKLDRSFAGRAFDGRLLSDLPADVDPCGENGEFHTFVWNSPDFATPLAVRPGEVVERDGFVFADVLLK